MGQQAAWGLADGAGWDGAGLGAAPPDASLHAAAPVGPGCSDMHARRAVGAAGAGLPAPPGPYVHRPVRRVAQRDTSPRATGGKVGDGGGMQH